MAQFGNALQSVWGLVSRGLPTVFTTQDYVAAIEKSAPRVWAKVTAVHGPGGKGTGNYYSPANVAFNFLARKSKEGEIFRRQFVPSRAGWGSHLVAQWEQESDGGSIPPEDADLDFVGDHFDEGRTVLRKHLARERAIGLRPRVLKARQKAGLSCDCCGRSEPRLSADLQEAVFEVHHKRPLSDGQQKTTIHDVNLLCAVCHRLMHKVIRMRGENVSAEELRRVLPRK